MNRKYFVLLGASLIVMPMATIQFFSLRFITEYGYIFPISILIGFLTMLIYGLKGEK